MCDRGLNSWWMMCDSGLNSLIDWVGHSSRWCVLGSLFLAYLVYLTLALAAVVLLEHILAQNEQFETCYLQYPIYYM